MKYRGLVALGVLVMFTLRPALGIAAPPAAIDRLLSAKIKHVFIIYQENRSFDSAFGTFPGANGVWAASARAHGFRQIDPLTRQTVTPFRLTDPDVYYESNARDVQLNAFDGGRMDRFVGAQAKAILVYEPKASAAQRFSVGAEAMYHIDCATIPYLWAFAHRFTLFDNFFQALRGPSTPSNVEIIAAQNGLTQYARHAKSRAQAVGRVGDPIFADIDPAFGPYNPAQPPTAKQYNQTYANVLLAMQRRDVGGVTADTDDVREDKTVIAKLNGMAIPWRWYEEGYNGPAHVGLVAHHLAPHYFGYIVKNQQMNSSVLDITQFYADLAKRRLPPSGVFYLKGGSHNTLGLHPANPDPFVQRTYLGDDDHPGYTDSQISQAFVASLVSTIAKSAYWKDAAIIITWDDLGGYWDHVAPRNFEVCPDGQACGDGARVPAIVISPFSKSGAVVHDFNDQDSVLKFVETVFGLPALASLPDERRYLPLGPRDGNSLLSNLRGAFDYERLLGKRKRLPAAAAVFANRTIRTIPAPVSCKDIGVQPLRPPGGISDSPPPGFNPRPFEPPPSPH
jgi:phospholipase C